eukprot:CCRYP_010777-RA/>CCRYP_010777-RA protein AED:0.22 eAED:0.28 QI:0/0/0/1/1/1/4/0/696
MIPSSISDTGATSTAGALHDPFYSTTEPSTKVFLLPTGGTAPPTHISQLLLDVRAPANQVDIVPNLTQTLLSGSKFADAGYTAVYDKDEVNFYDSNKIHINATSILQGYRCPHTGLCTFPSRKKRSRGTCVASAKTYDTHDTVYTDQTGRFPHASSRGNRYQMILYHTDSNSIWVEPTKNRTEGELILACTRALARMQSCGLSPKHQVLDNEASTAYKQAILNSGMTYQLVPPDDHRRNVAEKAIQTWKDHFIAVLSGTADKFPLHLWCQLIPHMERQLNLLRQSNANSRISAYAHLYGSHDYNASPFVPLGLEALVHDKPHRRKTYTQHCSKGWVIGTSTEHYRCWKMWSPITRSTCIAAPVFFKHKYLTNPSMTPADALIAAAANLAHVIKHNAKAQHVGSKNLQDLQRLQQLFSDTAKQQLLSPTSTKPVAPPAPPPRVQAQHQSLLPAHRPQQAPWYLMMKTVMMRWCHFQGCQHAAPSPSHHAHNPQHYHQLSTLVAEPVHSRTRPCYTSWPHVTYTQPRCSTRLDRRKDVTYGRIVANFRPEKDYPYRIRLTVGGNRINFPGDCGTPTADMITVKILLNSVISTVNAKFMTIDIKDFYLNTPMERPEYMQLKLSDIPTNIIELYRLRDIANDGYVFVRIQKGMYKPASLLSNSSNNASKSTATTKAKSTPDSGHMIGDPSVLPSLSMTSA